jgi:hypothetical protein
MILLKNLIKIYLVEKYLKSNFSNGLFCDLKEHLIYILPFLVMNQSKFNLELKIAPLEQGQRFSILFRK